MVLGFQMTAKQEFWAGGGVFADNIADTIDFGGEPGFGQFPGQPVPGFHVVRAVSGAVHAGFIRADGAQRVEVGEQAGGVDGGHGAAPRRDPCSATYSPARRLRAVLHKRLH